MSFNLPAVFSTFLSYDLLEPLFFFQLSIEIIGLSSDASVSLDDIGKIFSFFDSSKLTSHR